MEIFNGKKEAEKILQGLKKKIKQEKIKPCLAVILVGRNKASRLYVEIKKKQAKRIGLKIVVYKFSQNSSQKRIIGQIEKLNKSAACHGIIVQMPLPKKFKADRIIKAVSDKKDVDGFKADSLYDSVLPAAIFLALKKADKKKKNKKLVALVNSHIFGQKLQKFLRRKRKQVEYFLLKETSPGILLKKMKKADAVISVCGQPGFIKGIMIKKGAALIDAGISYLKNGKVIGDVDRKSIGKKACFFTPTPGGIGPLTVALLLQNVYLSAKYHLK